MVDFAIATVSMTVADDYITDTGVGTAIDATKTGVVTPTGRLEDGFLVVQNTFNGAKAVTILAGDNPPADAAGQGSLVTTPADGDASYAATIVAGLESARFLQNNGTLRMTFATSMTGFVYWVQLPRI